MTVTKIRVGISSCLLGQQVRFDGGHKHDRRITQELGEYFTWVPVCPRWSWVLARHANALQHLAGFPKRRLDSDEKSELHGVISDDARGWVPLVSPMTLLTHHLTRLSHPRADAQLYLEPYPRALRLRNRI